jgi:hypothetical protein
MKIALQYANKRDGCTMALFSKPKRKFWVKMCGRPFAFSEAQQPGALLFPFRITGAKRKPGAWISVVNTQKGVQSLPFLQHGDIVAKMPSSEPVSMNSRIVPFLFISSEFEFGRSQAES